MINNPSQMIRSLSITGVRPGSIPDFIISSKTWTCKETGLYRICALGAGASGGVCYETLPSNGSSQLATGGGGPGYSQKEIYIAKGTQLAIVVGAKGARIFNNGVSPFSSNGNDGGDTTVIGSGISLFAGGGKKGLALRNSSVTGLAGGDGGAASGGDINQSGGRGGNIAGASTNASYVASLGTGGGAAGSPYGDGGRGGDITGISEYRDCCSTGGGAIGGYHGNDPTAMNTIASSATVIANGVNGVAFATINRSGIPQYGLDGQCRSLIALSAADNSIGLSFESLNNPFANLNGSPHGSDGGFLGGVAGNGGSANAVYIKRYTFGSSGGGIANETSITTVYGIEGGDGIVVIERIG